MTSNFGASAGITHICTADPSSITVRGKDYCSEIIGVMSLTGFFFFHVTGVEPTPSQVRMLDALLVSIAEHGLAPTALAARMTYAASPEALQAAVAAGILGAGSVVLGASGEVATMIEAALRRVDTGETVEQAGFWAASDCFARGARLPGFGHPLHKPEDPRATRLLEIARSEGIAGRHVEMLEAIGVAADAVWHKKLVMNVQGPIAAIAGDMGMPPFLARAIPIIARAVGVLGHIAEEQELPIAFHVTMLANEAIRYEPPHAPS